MASRGARSFSVKLQNRLRHQTNGIRKFELQNVVNIRLSSSEANPKHQTPKSEAKEARSVEQPRKKTQAELDAELQLKMQNIAGDGGEAGIELEDGQPVAMKRSVRNNMFRYI
ncbi:hypothetical protein AOQ84DRAFT_371169 [Glonium stellatum]|uniref:Uncharacterized protein n=1 Tax=Glonium stellatum TaxID=574774 RepID=A0A8E2FDB0_9PEZI|nr:hypothetical protein AOQ84DRAFT_371169 [Glonium stellatum]